MGLLDKLNFFKRKPKEKLEEPDYSALGLSAPTLGPPEERAEPPPNPLEPPRPPLPMPVERARTTEHAAEERVAEGNIRARLDLMSTQLDSIQIHQESMSKRIERIEQLLRQALGR